MKKNIKEISIPNKNIFTAISEIAEAAILWLDDKLICIDCDNCDLLPFPIYSIIGRPLNELLPPKVINEIKERKKGVKANTFDPVIHFQMLDNDIIYNYKAAFIEVDKHVHALVLNQVQEDNENRLRLESSENKFRILLESAPQAILLVNIHGQITLANTSAERLFGYNRDELINKPIEMLVPVHLRSKHTLHRKTYLSSPQTRPMGSNMHITALHKNGSEFPVEVNLSSIELFEGPFILAFISDISERKELEDRLRQVEKLEAIGQLAGGIAHDFNNVLAGILGLTELAMRRMDSNHPAMKNLNLVVKKAESASTLVRQLLAFSRKQVITLQTTNLNTIIKNNKPLLQRYLGEDIDLITRLDENLDLIYSDLSAIDQIITNLSINARDAMPDGGDLIIQTENVTIEDHHEHPIEGIPKGKFVKLSITDTGIGMRQEVSKHIFEPFFTTKDIGEGTGLGLASVYGLVKQHNGYIQCKSKLGEGTTFEIYFPAVRKKEIEEPGSEVASDEIKGGNEHILVVEDEVDLLNVLKISLQEYGYKVSVAGDGLTALSVLEKEGNSIDLIISDVIMPKMGGVELKLFAERFNPSIKYMFITAHSDRSLPQEAVLAKPFKMDYLLKQVRRLLDA